jgi:hypothetical protein
LPQRGKRQKNKIAPCHSVANAKKTKPPLATTWQTPKRRNRRLPQRGKRQKRGNYRLRNLRKGQKAKFALCVAYARSKKRILPGFSDFQKLRFKNPNVFSFSGRPPRLFLWRRNQTRGVRRVHDRDETVFFMVTKRFD